MSDERLFRHSTFPTFMVNRLTFIVRGLGLGITIVVVGSLPLDATPGFWEAATQADFLRGEVERLSIDEHGRLTLGPDVRSVHDPSAPFVWTMVPGPDDSTFLGTGNDGKVVRLPIPQLTEERRKELVKVVRHLAEEGRVAVRNVRRDVMHDLKELVKNGDVGDDEERRAEERVQKLTDEHVARIEDLLKRKEAEIMEV